MMKCECCEKWNEEHMEWTLHAFWTQVAIVAVLHVLHSHDRLLAEVMPIVPPWEHPTWLS